MAVTSTRTSLSCANCMSNSAAPTGQGIFPGDEDSYVWDYKLVDSEMTTLSTLQALTLVFKGKTGEHCSVSSNKGVCLCPPCGKMFGKILEMRQEFLAVSLPNSFVRRFLNNETENCPPRVKVTPIITQADPLETSVVNRGPMKIQIMKISRQPTSPPRVVALPPPRILSGMQMRLPLSTMVVQGAPYPFQTTSQIPPRVRIQKRQATVGILKTTKQSNVRIQKPSSSQTMVRILKLRTPIQISSPVPAKRSRKEKLSDLLLQEYPEPDESVLSLPQFNDTIPSELIFPTDVEMDNLTLPRLCEDKPNYFDLSSSVGRNLEMKINVTVKTEKKKKERKRKKYFPNPYRVNSNSRQLQVMQKYSEEDQKLLQVKIYKCDECPTLLQNFETFRDWVLHHLQVHERDLGYGNADLLQTVPDLTPCHGLFRPCPECGNKKKSHYDMLQHFKILHSKQLSYPCSICGKKLNTKQSLEKHTKSFHEEGDNERPYLCTLCGSSYRSKGSLISHEKTHLGLLNLKYSCDLCTAKFISRCRLKEHITSHSDERPYLCGTCPMTFKTNRQLKAHVSYNHVEEKTPKVFCHICQKGFRRNIQLKGHLLGVHKLSKEDANKKANIKSFVFRVQENGDHVFYERERKPKTCEYCQKTYVRREGLFLHLISVHGKTEEESKEMTGLESKRNLFPGGRGGRRRNVKRNK